MTRDPEPIFTYPYPEGVDQLGDWKAENIEWRSITVPRLYIREQFSQGESWGKNSWGELFKGRTVRRLYVQIPEYLTLNYNLAITFGTERMLLLRDAQPDFVRPAGRMNPELHCYYLWMGEAR